jgi:hypothetical protein
MKSKTIAIISGFFIATCAFAQNPPDPTPSPSPTPTPYEPTNASPPGDPWNPEEPSPTSTPTPASNT